MLRNSCHTKIPLWWTYCIPMVWVELISSGSKINCFPSSRHQLRGALYMLWVLVPVGRGTKALHLALHTALQAWRFSPQLSEIHATVIAQPNTIVLHLAVAQMLLAVPCKESVAWHFDGENGLKCWSMSVTVNSLDSHGEWSRSFFKSSRSYTFNSGFS